MKPANLGSSVGISKVKTADELAPAIELALAFDRKVVVEAGVPDAREIECAVLGNDDPEASVAGEIIPSREFYDYEAKYLDEGSKTVIPADLTPAQLAEVQRLAIAAFKAIDGAGMSRVDFLLSRATGAFYSTRSTPSPASPPSACSPSCGRRAAWPSRRWSIASSSWRSSAITEKQRLRTSVL